MIEESVKRFPWRRTDGGGNDAAVGGAAKGTLGSFFKAVKSDRCVVCNKPCGGKGGVCTDAASDCQSKVGEVQQELKLVRTLIVKQLRM